MMTALFAENIAGAYNWNVVTALGVLVALALNGLMFVRTLTGRANEHQIEPTQLHAITRELGAQTKVLSDINREVGEVKTTVDIVKAEVGGFHTRVGGISRELAATTARVDGLEKREDK